MAKDQGETRDRASAPADLAASPSQLLHRALQVSLDIYAEEFGDNPLTQRQFAVLSAVEAREGLTQTDLVRATGIDRSTLADMVARMIAKGLLGRERSATDARANAVHLTADGRAVLNEARPRMAATDARLLALLSAGKREGFINQLRKLVQAGEAVGGAESEARVESAAQDGVETVSVIAPPKAKKSKGDKAKDGKKKKKGKRRADETPAA